MLSLMIAEASEVLQFDAIDDVLRDVAAGRIVIVTDDADRENEGDLIMAAEKVTPQAVNFMTMHGRGLICVPITNERAEQLGLQRMVAQNREMYRTDFTVSVDAAKGVTTGISAHDRAATIQTIANPKSDAGRFGATRSRLSASRKGWRRVAPRRSHRSGGRSRATGRAATERRALRNSAR